MTRRIRFNAKATDVAAAEMDILVNGSWITVFNGPFTDSAWTEAQFNLSNVSQARIAFEATANNRGFEFRLSEFDFFNSPLTAVVNQSKLDNWGPTNASCYLFMKTQFWNGSAWLDDDVVVNDTTPRVLKPTDFLKLDTIWNPNNYTTNNLSFGNGVYRVYAACLDNASNVLMDINGSYVFATYNFTYDTVPPSVIITSPINGTNYTLSSTIPIYVNATDPLGVSSVVANVSTNIGSELVTLIYNSTSGLWETGYTNTYYVTTYTISIIATDNAGNINNDQSAWVNVIDSTPPTVVLVSPQNGFTNSSVSSTDVTFTCNATDNYDTHNISLYITNADNQSFALNSTAAVSGVYTHANFTLNLSDGAYTWNCLAYDSSGNYAWAPANRSLTIGLPNCPLITSSGTYNQTTNNAGAPNNASPLSGLACVLINASNVVFNCNGYTITNNGTAGTTYGVLLDGPLTNVTLENCPDISDYSYGAYAYLSNHSQLSNITAFNNTQDGFYLNSSSNDTLANDTAYGNPGGVYVANSTSNSISGGNFTNNTGAGIGFDQSSGSNSLSLNRICYNGATDVNNSFSSGSSGSYDYCGLWSNWTESNHSGCTFSCSYVWHEFFGNLSGEKFLAPNNAQIFYSWLWNGNQGRVYAVRGGASINWVNITALGRNRSGGNTSNDFTTLDSLLNMSGKPDSISALYSSDGSDPLLTKNLSVYNRDVVYVPLANSTTASAAKTGITWDGSQGANSYFNAGDNQDVVFVNEINSSQQYNYMIRVPSNLATYKGGSTVQFWAELD
jgi:parallel beta-helix repeat protein